jgi:hypothetical protein
LTIKFPLYNYTDTANVDGNSPLKWVWLAQNDVNKRIGKKQVSWDECKKVYATGVPCHECAVDVTVPRPRVPPPTPVHQSQPQQPWNVYAPYQQAYNFRG